MDRGEGYRGEQHAKPSKLRARQRLQRVAAEKHFFGRRREHEEQGRRGQGLADGALARRIEAEMNAASHGRQKSSQKKRRGAEYRSETEIPEPTAMRRTSQSAERQLFEQCPTRPADHQCGKQNRPVSRSKAPIAVG